MNPVASEDFLSGLLYSSINNNQSKKGCGIFSIDAVGCINLYNQAYCILAKIVTPQRITEQRKEQEIMLHDRKLTNQRKEQETTLCIWKLEISRTSWFNT